MESWGLGVIAILERLNFRVVYHILSLSLSLTCDLIELLMKRMRLGLIFNFRNENFVFIFNMRDLSDDALSYLLLLLLFEVRQID